MSDIVGRAEVVSFRFIRFAGVDYTFEASVSDNARARSNYGMDSRFLWRSD
jgi:hypothetical protein